MRIAAAQLTPLHRTLSILLGLTVSGAAGLAAQRPVHQVRGVVTDTELAPVAGVEVLIAGGSRTTTTDARGRFVLDSVPEGKVRLTVRRVGCLALHPTITVPMSPGDMLQVILLPFAQQLEPIQVDVPRRGVSGVATISSPITTCSGSSGRVTGPGWSGWT